MLPEEMRLLMAQYEQVIGFAYMQQSLFANQEVAWQGPHTLTFQMRLYEPTPQNLRRALGMAGTLEAHLRTGPVRIYADAGAICIEVPSPYPENRPAPQLRGQRLAVPLGLGTRRNICGVDLASVPHLLVVGPTRRGKTTALRAIAYHLARQNHPGRLGLVVLCAPAKLRDWSAVGALPHAWATVTAAGESQAALTWLAALVAGRAGRQPAPLVVIVDDLLNLLAVAPGVADPLGELASLGAGAGTHLLIGTQSLGQKGAGALIERNIPGRLLFGMASAQDAAFAAGRSDTGAERLGHYPGDALLCGDGAPVRLAVSRATDADFRALCRGRVAEYRPWLAGELAPPAPLAAVRTTGATANEGGETAPGAVVLPFPDLTPVQDRLPYDAPWPEKCARLLAAWDATGGATNETLRRVGWTKSPRNLAWLHKAVDEREASA